MSAAEVEIPDVEVVRRTIEAYADRFSAADREGWLELFAPDATLEDPVGSPIRKGREEIGAFWDETHGMVDSIALVLDRPVTVMSDEAVMVFHAASVVGGQKLRVDIVDHFRVDGDGLIRSQRAFWDPATIHPE